MEESSFPENEHFIIGVFKSINFFWENSQELKAFNYFGKKFHHKAITCSKLTIETLEQGWKYIHS